MKPPWKKLLALGVARVIVGTIAIESPELLAEWAARYAGKIAVGIDARAGWVAIRGWEQTSEVDACELALKVKAAGIDRVIYTDIATDGMMTGPNLEMTKKIAQVSSLKVTASGGIGSLADLKNIKMLEKDGVDSCIVGRAIYEKRFTVKEAIAAVA